MLRRDFLKTTGAALAFSAMPAFSRSAGAGQFADVKKRVALIGTGWYGKSDLFRLVQVAPNIEIVSLCDADANMLNACADMCAERQASKKRPRTFKHYQELLDQKDVDIALIATPDHWHALPMIAAAKAGCDIYVQKPISVDVIEGQAMLAAARKYKRVVQVGMQRRSTPHLITARDRIIREGKLGKIGLVEIYCYYGMRATANPPDSTPPPNLDYELWTGPAPMRPYNDLVHPRKWRAYMEYGNGIVGDMCVHMLDMVRWMMDLGMPNRVSSSGGILVQKSSRANITDTQTATFSFGDLPVIWTHRSYGSAPDPKYPWAATLYGDKGTLKAGVMGYDFIPTQGESKHVDVRYELEEYPIDKVEKDLEKHVAPAIRGHMRNLLSCIESREKPVSDIEQGYMSASACILANVSQKLGRSLTWDHAKGQVVGDAEANKLLARPYRAPYVHPDPAAV